MKHRLILAVALALPLALPACDEAETVISQVNRRGNVTVDALWTMQDGRGLPVEIHGRPFAHGSDSALVEALRPPARAAKVTFYPRPPGGWLAGHPSRLVLHFNAHGGANPVADCQRVAESPTNPPRAGTFSVTASFCQGPDWEAYGHLEALDIEDGDLEAFGDMMGQLMLAIFHEEKDR